MGSWLHGTVFWEDFYASPHVSKRQIKLFTAHFILVSSNVLGFVSLLNLTWTHYNPCFLLTLCADKAPLMRLYVEQYRLIQTLCGGAGFMDVKTLWALWSWMMLCINTAVQQVILWYTAHKTMVEPGGRESLEADMCIFLGCAYYWGALIFEWTHAVTVVENCRVKIENVEIPVTSELLWQSVCHVSSRWNVFIKHRWANFVQVRQFDDGCGLQVKDLCAIFPLPVWTASLFRTWKLIKSDTNFSLFA